MLKQIRGKWAKRKHLNNVARAHGTKRRLFESNEALMRRLRKLVFGMNY